jgi:hypothetical protein
VQPRPKLLERFDFIKNGRLLRVGLLADCRQRVALNWAEIYRKEQYRWVGDFAGLFEIAKFEFRERVLRSPDN